MQPFKGPTRLFHKGLRPILCQTQLSNTSISFFKGEEARWDEGWESIKHWSASLQSHLHYALLFLSLWIGTQLDIALQCACSKGERNSHISRTYPACKQGEFTNPKRNLVFIFLTYLQINQISLQARICLQCLTTFLFI